MDTPALLGRFALVLTMTGCACQGPCVQPAQQSSFTHVLTAAQRAMFPAADGTYRESPACRSICDPLPSEAGTSGDSGVSVFNRLSCTIRGNELDCQFELICGG